MDTLKNSSIRENPIWNIIVKIMCSIILFFQLIYNKIKYKGKKSDRKEKIMILIGKICRGGAERAAVNLAEKLSKHHDVVIVTFDKTYNKKEIERYSCQVDCIEVDEARRINKIRKIKKLKKVYGITHCISFGTQANFLNIITRIDEKVIISVRNYLSISEKDKKLRVKHEIASKFCDYIVAVSETVKNDQIKNFHVKEEKICAISNYCNKEYIKESIKEYTIDEQDKALFENRQVIITVGKLKKQKGQWHLVRAFSEVVKKHKEAKLLILGTGELEEYLKKLVSDMHLGNHVYILGHKNKNVYTYMAESNIFAFPTLFEGMPNVILEAMECGLPIIATDCFGGNKEIIAPSIEEDSEIQNITKCEYGILIPKLDFNQYNATDTLTKEELMMAEAINEMLENQELLEHYQAKSLERVADYHQEKYVEEWEELL